MPRRKSQNNSLEQALALLIQNQANFVSQIAETNKRLDERCSRIDERFSRIDEDLKQIKAILLRHEQMLQALPEAVRDKIGFKRE